ncbi:fe(2+) transport protein 1-like [Silene latifolia]|uniref:fe(2+) transport protein 1-like n=1 Tax=Silene latifolia TaxID=37657 RepID=UPI003D77D3C9
MTMKQILLILIIFVLSDHAFAKSEENAAKCTSAILGPCHNKNKALRYNYIAIGTILVSSIIGVSLPLFSRAIPAFQPNTSPFLLLRSFASGVIVATGFMHVMPDSWNDLTSPCLPDNPWRVFPFTPFITMLSAYMTMMMDSFTIAYFERKNKSKQQIYDKNENKDDETDKNDQLGLGNQGNGSCHHHGQFLDVVNKDSKLKDRVVAQVLELGIVVHSVVIGLSMGASDNSCTIKPLIAAICFHQLFEGMGLGGCILQAEYGLKIKAIMVFFFSVTTPSGIVLGILLQNVYKENSPTALIVVGVLNAVSAGLLIYMAMVDLLSADFKGPKLQANMKLHFWCYVVALLGSGLMSLMAKWA